MSSHIQRIATFFRAHSPVLGVQWEV